LKMIVKRGFSDEGSDETGAMAVSRVRKDMHTIYGMGIVFSFPTASSKRMICAENTMAKLMGARGAPPPDALPEVYMPERRVLEDGMDIAGKGGSLRVFGLRALRTWFVVGQASATSAARTRILWAVATATSSRVSCACASAKAARCA
jgi:hypothetical protein